MTTLTSGDIGLHNLSPDANRTHKQELITCITLTPSTLPKDFADAGTHCGKFQSFLEGAALRTFSATASSVSNKDVWNTIVQSATKSIEERKEMCDTVLPDLPPDLSAVERVWLDQQNFHRTMLEGKHYVIGMLLDGSLVTRNPGHAHFSTLWMSQQSVSKEGLA